MKWLKRDMGYRGKIGLLMLITTVLPVMIFIVAVFPLEIGFCRSVHTTPGGKQFPQDCLMSLSTFEGIAEPLFFLSLAILLTLIPLFFTKEAVYRSWKKFSLFFIPIALVIIFNTPTHVGGFAPAWDRQLTTGFFSVLFLIISLLIMIIRSWKLRKQK